MRDIKKLIEMLDEAAENCDAEFCRCCQLSDCCENGWKPDMIGDLINDMFEKHKRMYCEQCGVCSTGEEDPEECEIYTSCCGIDGVFPEEYEEKA